MNNYNSFISKAKKARLVDDLLSFIFFLGAIFVVFYYNFNLFFRIIVITFVFFQFFKMCYQYYKLSHFSKTLTINEQEIIEQELLTLFFEGVDYALTENYIIDLRKVKLIPIEAILRIEKVYSLTTNSIDTSLETYVKIYTDNSSYKYLVKCRGLGFNFSFGPDPYYKNLYNYIKFKKPSL